LLTVHRPRRVAYARDIFTKFQAPLVVIAGVLAIYWKLVFTTQYSSLEFYDANQILPWLQVQVFAIRHFTLMLWDPYEWAGQSLVGQLQPGVFSPFNWLLALAPLDDHGHVNLHTIYIWFALLHVVAALFAYFLFRDLGLRKAAAVVGALFYGTAGFLGNTFWIQMVEAALWAPLVFLFLLRSLRGRAPLRSAALAGVALGLSWCGGHHGPSLTLSLAVLGVWIWAFFRNNSHRGPAAFRAAFMFLLCGLVAAPQIWASLEYERRSVRWTSTGMKQWTDQIPFSEHEQYGLSPANLHNIFMPGGNGLMADPFVGVVALTLAAVAVMTDFRRREVRIFLAIALAALLYSMSRSNFLYGLLYSLAPFVQKLREPILALSVFQFAMAGLVAFGAERLLDAPAALPIIRRVLLWFGAATLGLFYLIAFLRPAGLITLVETDPRIGMTALIAWLLAATLTAANKGLARPSTVIVFTGFLLLLEQGNESGSRLVQNSDKKAVFLAPFANTQDMAYFLHQQSQPFRVEADRKDIAFNFGDWNRIDTVLAYTASAPAETLRLQWWQDRTAALYGTEYSIAKTSNRPGQQDVFTSTSGFKIFRNPPAFPRGWAVHTIKIAPDEDRGAVMVREGDFDLRTTAVMTENPPQLDTCGTPDMVGPVSESPQQVSVEVRMMCTGMLIVSDNFYPGWSASLDGKHARIWQTDTSFRGVVVPAGEHRVVMAYRPLSIYGGGVLALLGFAIAIVLQRRTETNETDLLNDSTSPASL
jgi:hypothetical protein